MKPKVTDAMIMAAARSLEKAGWTVWNDWDDEGKPISTEEPKADLRRALEAALAAGKRKRK